MNIQVRPRNWLPLPGQRGISPAAIEEPQVVDENDRFSKATVEEFYPRQGYGAIKTDNGTLVPFDLRIASLVGEKNDPAFLKAGMRVGYDLGKTSKGPRVSTLKIY